MENVTIKSKIHGSFFESVEEFLDNSTLDFYDIETKNIKIFMPTYFKQMWAVYLRSELKYGNPSLEGLDKWRGVEILENYQNNIVVSFKNIQLTSLSFHTLQIP